MDFRNPLGIEYRVVKNVPYEGKPARIVSGTRRYETDAVDLWDALTNVERIPRWFQTISGDLELGGRFQIEGNASGEIKRCEPPEVLQVTWEYGGNVSWVHVTLVPEDGGTRLLLEHIMLQDPESESHWKKYGPGATGVGWDLGFLGLGLHLKLGQVISQEATYAWLATEAGKNFLRTCATAWGASHVESGEDSDVATAMAESTAKFYCGEI